VIVPAISTAALTTIAATAAAATFAVRIAPAWRVPIMKVHAQTTAAKQSKNPAADTLNAVEYA